MTAQRTPLYDSHLANNATMVEFCGWQMPIYYGSQIDEHHAVRKAAGIFDVSHMNVVDIQGDNAHDLLLFLLANNLDKLKNAGDAQYSLMLNPEGGVIDDLIIYLLADNHYRLVLNAATHDKDMAWIEKQNANFNTTIIERDDLAMIALQGPKANNIIEKLFPNAAEQINALKLFKATTYNHYYIARTGYTGENGFEIILPNSEAKDFWQQCLDCGATACGLGARDTLRLEAGLNLYGHDMDETTSPLESNLAWVLDVKSDRDFIGKEALLTQQQNGQVGQPDLTHKLTAVYMTEKGVLRDHQKIIFDDGSEGVITSGSFSPTLQMAIGLARVPNNAQQNAYIDRRGKKIPIKLCKPPFIRQGKNLFLINTTKEIDDV